MSENIYYKAINFDFDTKNLKEFYPGKNWRNAYKDIKKFLKKNGFSHRQGSGYVSDKKLTELQMMNFADKLAEKFPWIYECASHFDVTNVSETYDLTEIFAQKLQQKKLSPQNITKPKPSMAEQLAAGQQRADAENAKNALNKASIHKKDVSL